MTDFILHCSPGSDWLVGFTDRNGQSRLLPTRKKWFGHWRTTNCPINIRYIDSLHPTRTDGTIVVVSAGNDDDLTPDDALIAFKKRFASVEEYLGWLND